MLINREKTIKKLWGKKNKKENHFLLRRKKMEEKKTESASYCKQIQNDRTFPVIKTADSTNHYLFVLDDSVMSLTV